MEQNIFSESIECLAIQNGDHDDVDVYENSANKKCCWHSARTKRLLIF